MLTTSFVLTLSSVVEHPDDLTDPPPPNQPMRALYVVKSTHIIDTQSEKERLKKQFINAFLKSGDSFLSCLYFSNIDNNHLTYFYRI